MIHPSRSLCLVIVTLAAFWAGASVARAAPFTLNNGPGDGTVMVGVDGFGAFGLAIGSDATDAFYDPVGALGPTATTFESGVAIGSGGPRSFLTSGDIGGSGGLSNPTVTGSPTSASSSFSSGGLSFVLTQMLAPIFAGGSQTGSQLTQVYMISNTTGGTLDFDLVRYIDGDLRFDGSLTDGGGRLLSGGTEILFETDSATGAADPTTFVGITGEGGTIPATNRFEIDSFSGLRGRIIAGTALDDILTGDGTADGFIDAGSGFDVTLALRNVFSLGAGETAEYTTRTIFGSGAPGDVPPPGGGAPIPEPGTLLLIGSGLVGIGVGARRRGRRK